MLKRIALLILTCLFAMTALSGCSIIAEQNEKSLIENALKERYGEEFVCMRTWNNAAGGYYDDSFYGLCHPKDDESLLFEILLNGDGSISYDDYGSTIISKRFADIFDEQIGASIGEHYTYCCNYSILNDDITCQRIENDNFTFDYFFSSVCEKYDDNKLGLYYAICIDVSKQLDTSYEKEYDLIVSALEYIFAIGITYNMNLKVYLDLYFVPNDIYDECLDYFDNNARRYAFDNIVEGFPKQYNRKIEIIFENNAFNITKADYINLRKELN